MPRVKRGTTHTKKRRRLLKKVKGYSGGRKKLIKSAKTAATKAGAYAYRDRKTKKRDFRRQWQLKISAACKQNNTSYSKFINLLKVKKIDLNRKMLAEIAEHNPKAFAKLVKEASK